MHPRDLIGGLNLTRLQATKAALFTVSLAKPAAAFVGSGLGFVKSQAAAMVPTREGTTKTAVAVVGGLDLTRQQTTKPEVSAVSLAKPVAGLARSGLGFVKRQATALVSTREGTAKTAAVVVGSAVSVYFLWPAVVDPATTGALMKAPGVAGFVISRAAFVANPQVYFQIVRTTGPATVAAYAFM